MHHPWSWKTETGSPNQFNTVIGRTSACRWLGNPSSSIQTSWKRYISIAKLSGHSLVDARFQMFAMQASRGTCYLLAIASAVDKRNNWDFPLRQSSENKVCWELATAVSWVAQFLVGVCGGINSGLSALTGWLLNAYLIEAQGTLASEAGLVRTKRESSLLRWMMMMMMVHIRMITVVEFHMY